MLIGRGIGTFLCSLSSSKCVLVVHHKETNKANATRHAQLFSINTLLPEQTDATRPSAASVVRRVNILLAIFHP